MKENNNLQTFIWPVEVFMRIFIVMSNYWMLIVKHIIGLNGFYLHSSDD